MSNNLYNILGKLQKLDAADKAAKKPITESTQVGTRDIVELLNEKYQGWKKTVKEASKPDFPDIDGDGDKKESMKKAAADKKAGPKKGVNPFAKKNVAEGNFKQTPGQRQYGALHSQLQSLANSGQINTPNGKQKAEKMIDTIQQLVDTDPSCAGSTVPSKKIWLSEQGVAEGGASMPGDQYLSIPADQTKLSIGQQMAQDGITYSPDKEDELIGLMAQYMKKAGMNSKAIRYYLNYDEDYISDQLSDLPKKSATEGMYDASPKKVDIPAYQRKAKGGDWKVTQQDLDADDEKNMSSKAGLAKLKRDLDMNEDQVNEYETDSKGRYVHKGTYGGAVIDDGNEDDYDEFGNKKAGAKKTASASDEPKKRGRPAKNKGPERVTAKAYKHKGGRVQEAINLDTFVEDAMNEIAGVFVTEKAKSKAQQKFMGMVYAAKQGEKPASVAIGDVAKGMSKKSAKDYASTKHKGLPQHVNESIQLNEGQLQAIVRKFGKEVRDFANDGDLDNDLFDALYDYYFDDMPYGVKKARDGDPYEWVSERFYDAIQHGDVEISESNVDSMVDLSFGNDNELTELARLAGLGEMDRAEYIKQQDNKAERNGNTEFNAFGQLFKTDEINEGQCNLSEAGKMCPVHGMVECGSMYESKGKPDYIDLDKDGDTKEPMKKAAKDAKETVKEDLQADDGEHYDDEADFFGKFEADHFDKEVESDGGMEVRGYIDGVNVMVWRFDDESKTSGYGVYNDDMLSECGVPGSMGGESDSGMSVNASYDTKTGRKTVTVTADGEAAEQLAQMLKMAGMHGHGATSTAQPMHVHSADEVQEEFINEPDEKYAGIDTIIDQGDDLNRKKTQDPATANRAANPMKENVLNLEGRLAAMYNALKIKTK